MASSQLTSTSAPTLTATSTENIPAAKDNESAANDPDFAIICAFLQKFAKDVGVDIPNFGHLHEWLVNTDEVSQQLRDMHIKLLRKTRKTVHEKCWESALSKFCFGYSAQDAWEIERFGYKKSSLKVKLRILRELLESQFERNNKFRSKLLTYNADSLRSQPIGRDKLGHTYWLTQDDDCNLRIYQEHLDEEIWRVVATNREELVNLIARLRGNEVVLPSTDIGIDEDTSSSNSCAAPIERPPPPEEQDDSQEEPALKVPNLRIKLGSNKIRPDQEELVNVVSERNVHEDDKIKNDDIAVESKNETTKKVKPLIISQRGASSPNVSSSSKRRNNDEDSVSLPASEELNVKRSRPSLLDSRRSNKPSKYFKQEEEPSSSLDGELDEEEAEEEDIDSVAAEEDENEEKDIEEYDDDFETEVSEAVEDPTVYVHGNGAGNDCDGGNDNQNQNEYNLYLSGFDVVEEQTFSETIEDPVVLIFNEGNGLDCLVGNKNEENETTPNEPKATFFFGEPGCLKLSPIKLNPSTTLSRKLDEKSTVEKKLDEEKGDDNTQCDKDKINDETTEKGEDPLKSLTEETEETDANIKKQEQIELNGENESKDIEKVDILNKITEHIDDKKSDENNGKTQNDVQSNLLMSNDVKTKTESDEDIEEIHIKECDGDVSGINEDTKEENKNSSSVNKAETKEVEIEIPPKAKCQEALKTDDKKLCLSLAVVPESEIVAVKKENGKGSLDMEEPDESPKPVDFSVSTKMSLQTQVGISKVPKTLLSANSTPQTIPAQEPAAPNRKRRLVDSQKPLQPQQSTSESDLDPHTDRQDDSPTNDGMLKDIGCKRLKMRPKCSNSEIRKKVEAKLDANLEETTSSSGDEDAKKPSKIISPKKESQKLPEHQSEEPIKPDTSKFTILQAVSSTSCPPVASTSTGTKQKPTLSEIIEKKLKKTPPKSEEQISSIQTIFTPPKKTPITKPLKKNLLTQLRESDEEAVPRKRTLSNATSVVQNTAITPIKAELMVPDAKEEVSPKAEEPKSMTINEPNLERKSPEKQVSALKTTNKNSAERKTPERHRKRQNSEEPSPEKTASVELNADSNCNAVDNVKKSREANEENKANKANSSERRKEANNTNTDSTEKILDLGKSSTPKIETVADSLSESVGRRSSRRCGGSVLYAELPQTKRTRAGTKPAKIEDVKEEKEVETDLKAEVKIEKAEIQPIKSKLNDAVTVKSSSEMHTPKNDTDEKKLNKVANTPTGKSNLKKEEKPVEDDENFEDQIKANIVKKPESTLSATGTEPGPNFGPGRGRGPRKKREVDTTNIIDEDSETPVRQSRRIAQQKIREEAERRKLEEIALRTMKQELKKKKKAEKEADPTVAEPSERSSSSSSDSEVETKKKLKKKCPGKDGWSSGSEEVEEPEEEDEYPHHYETDAGSPLFKSDHEFSPESDLEDETQIVPMKRARTARKEDAGDDHGSGDEEACQKCGKSDHPEWILLCDICDKGYHCSCLSPVIFYIPEGDWFCPPCQQEQLIVALEKQLQELDEIVEKKRIANEEEKRLAELAEREEQERLAEEEEQRRERRKHKQKKRHRDDSSNENSSADSEKEEHDDKHEDRDVEKGTGKLNLRDDDSSDESQTSKPNNKRNVDKIDKNKRRRGDGRNRRRRAAARGARRRRRLDKSSGSGSASDSNSASSSGSGSESSSDSFSDSDDEPIYKLRKRRQINVSYRLNEYDDLINSALKKEMDEVAGAGNAGRGKDITTIIEADKEEKARLKQIEEKEVDAVDDDELKEEEGKETLNEEAQKKASENQDDSDDEKPLKGKVRIKTSIKKKSRKLTTLDISSEEDNASDEDFKTSSLDDDEEDEDTSISASTDSDTSLEVFRRRGKNGKKKQRKAARRAARERRKVKKFVVEDSDDEEIQVKKKKKRKKDSDYTESETDDNELSELSENIDSADLCDDTTSEESDGAWHPSRRKKQRKTSGMQTPRSSEKQKKTPVKKVKQLEYSDDDISESEEEDDDEDDDVAGGGKGSGKQPRSVPLIPVNSNKSNNSGKKGKPSAAGKKKPKRKQSEEELSFSDSGDSTRRTRGRRYAYIEDFDDDSSDGGIKPGVKRPDTPPEEREKFIKKQEEIKRMLAEKNAEGAKLAATPRLTPIKAVSGVTCSDKDKRSPAKLGQDSLSTVPLSVIRQAKVLDIDYLQRKGESVGDLDNADEEVDSEFDDADLPDDLPEDMDEDAIARMVEEEEEFGAAVATRELPAPDEVLRTPNKSKTKDTPIPTQKSTNNPSLEALSQMQGGAPIPISAPPPTASGLQEPTRKRLPMPTLHPPLLRHQYPHPPHTQSGNIMLHGAAMHRHPPPTHLLQNALSAPLGQPLNRNFPIQHAHNATLPMPTRQLLPPTRPVHAERSTASTAGPSGPNSSTAPVESDIKPRGRRKKITPLRDPTQKQAASSGASASNVHADKTPSSESLPTRISTVVSSVSSVIKTSAPILSVAQPPQLYKSQVDANLGGETQTSVITRMPHLPPGRMIFPGADVARFYSTLPPPGSTGPPRQLTTNIQRPHRGPPLQMPPGIPPPPISTSSYVPPHARHAPSHLNPYRPTIYGNPSFGQPRSLSTTTASIRIGGPPTTGPEYLSGPRPFPPYGYYPPPPPLTTTHLPTPPSSVIVAAPSSVISSTAPPVVTQTSTISTITTHSSIERAPSEDPKSTPEEIIPSKKLDPEPPKKLTTLDVYTPSNAKSPLAIGGGESSGSQPDAAEDSPTSATQCQTKAGEFSGLVSYFSSQHDDYNT